MFWKTETIRGKFHMYFGNAMPNIYWDFYEPDIDTEKFYRKKAKLDNGNWAIIEIRENEI